MSCIALAEKISADQNGKIKEIQEIQLVRNKKEDNTGDGHEKENNDKFPVDREIPC